DGVTMADLRGHSLRRVVAYLGSVGLRARLIPAAEAPGGDGLIGGTVPAPGAAVGKGTEVTPTAGHYLPPEPETVDEEVVKDRETDEGLGREQRAAGPARRSRR